ncbi:MAG: tetratricopeptide repeat protein [Bacteroidia bacterium]|nr:tetratricopeptide repeat protein [Bacteroidia bacterium]
MKPGGQYLFFLVMNLLLMPGNFFSQSKTADSLLGRLKNAKEDSNKVNLLNDLGWEIKEHNPDSAILLSKNAIAIAKKIQWNKGTGDAYNNLGAYSYLKAEYADALSWHTAALKIRTLTNDRKGIAASFGNIGLVYRMLGNYSMAIEFYFKALKIADETGDLKLQANNLGNIGVVYRNMGNFDGALDYYFKALQKTEFLHDKAGAVRHLANIGIVYYSKGDYDKALEYYFKALKRDEEAGNKNGMAKHLGNIGAVYQDQKNFDEALAYYSKALKLREELGAKNLIASSLGNMGKVYSLKKNYSKALEFCKKSLELAVAAGDMDMCKEDHEHLFEIYAATGDFKKALNEFKRYISLRDSLSNEAATKKTIQTQMQYDFDKKSVADSIKNSEAKKFEEIKHGHEIARQKTFTYGGIAGFLVMIVVAVISFLAFRNKKKANIEIARQKQLVEAKQKEILDSIYYARRIQRTLITSEKYIEKKLLHLRKEK